VTSEGFDPARAVAFAERVLGIVNGGALSLLLSLGHRAGLFDVMRRLGAATSGEIAREAGLEADRVREWLTALAASGIVERGPAGSAFRLPAEHAACLSREAQPSNLAQAAQWIPLLAQAEDEVLDGFAGGGGADAGGRFRQALADESDRTSVAAFVDGIVPRVPGLRAGLEAGIDVLDVGCRAGRALCLLAETFPNSRFVGSDEAEDAIEAARAQAGQRGIANARFEARDLAAPGASGAYDLVTVFGALRGRARPDASLAGIARALRPAGILLMCDVRGSDPLAERDAEDPLAPFLYAVACLYGAAAPRAAEPDADSREALLRRLAAAGFTSLEVHTLPHDPIHRYALARRGV
jgi:SAM-dependent methyltransferase